MDETIQGQPSANRFTGQLTMTRLLALITLVAVFVVALRPPLDGDTLWHLRAGQWQVENRAILRTDLFSHTRYGEAWVNHSWLSQVLIYGAYAALGDWGLALFVALLATAGMALVFLQCPGDPLIRAGAVVLAAAAATVFWSARPQIVSFFLSTVVLYLLWLYSNKGVDRLWLIPPLMALWANLHGGFAIGFILLVLSLGGEVASWLFDGVLGGRLPGDAIGPVLRPILRLVVIGLVSAAAVSLNPYGPAMLLYPFRTVGIGVLQDAIQEWASPNFHEAQTWPFIWLLLGTLVVAGLSRERLGWRNALLLSGTAYSALLAGRNIPTFAIVAAPVLARHANALLEERNIRLRWDQLPTTGVYGVLNWTLAVVVLAGGAVWAVRALDPETVEEARRASQPVEAAAYLESAGAPEPIFNSYNWGGYLIWAARDYLVYVDGRTDLYDDEFLREYLAIHLAQEGWEEKLDETGVNTVIVEASSPLGRSLADVEGWSLAYEDELAVVYVRDSAADG
jgi:hypothetical protein